MAKESRKSGPLFLVGVLALCAAILATPGHAAVGRTAGSLNVSNSGSASYTIPIFTPPGPRGMQPSIALTYNSNGGVGYLGTKWALAGLSSISRCEPNLAQDGVVDVLHFWVNDRYCLDGNRLRLQSGDLGSTPDGSVWATEIANYSRITANDTVVHYGLVTGPESWTVEHRDGTTYTYGGTSDSRARVGTTDVPRAWLLSQIEDRSGNKVVFTYKTQDGTYTVGTTHPIKIEWTRTSHGSGDYLYSMEFSYGDDANAAASSYAGYQAGYLIRDTDLLNSISVKNNGTTVRKYLLDYSTSPTTGAKRLTSVTECSDSAGSDCLPETTIAYQNGTAGVPSTATSSFSGVWTTPDGSHDFNGDGLKDLLYMSTYSFKWRVRLALPTGGYGSQMSQPAGMETYGDTFFAGDIFGNGRDVILALAGSSTRTWHVYMFNGSSFTAVDTGLGASQMALADVDADGRADLVYLNLDTWGNLLVSTRPSTSEGTTPSFGEEVNSPILAPPEGFYISGWSGGGVYSDYGYGRYDANGDGREDIFVLLDLTFCSEEVGCFGENIYAASLQSGNDYQFTERNDDPGAVPANLNGDGCGDSVTSTSVSISLCTVDNTSISTAGVVRGMLDWNGDGRQDPLVQLSSDSSQYYVQLSTGVGLDSPVATGIPMGQLFITDANGDGQQDLGRIDYSTGTVYVYVHSGAHERPDLATSFTDGYGVVLSVTYKTSTLEGYTANTNATYPRKDVTAPQTLVRTATLPDGVGSTYTITYSYFGATLDPLRGGEGFDKVESVDSRSGIKHAQIFSKGGFPFTGMLLEDKLYQPAGSGGALISSRIVTLASLGAATIEDDAYNERYFPHSVSSTEDVREVGGTKNGDLITQTITGTTWDKYTGNLTASSSEVTDRDSSSPNYLKAWTTATTTTFDTDPDRATYWCQGLPIGSSVTRSTTVSGESTVAQSKTLTPDYVNCRMDAESVGSGNLKVTTAYEYDDFGNIDKVKVTGRNLTDDDDLDERVSETIWGSADGTPGGTGQFPASVTNALGQETERTFDPTFGSLVTEEDPNNIVLAHNYYDGFGRLTRTVRADGTGTRLTYEDYADCATYGCLTVHPTTGVTGIGKLIVIASERNTSDAQIRDSLTYTDEFDRPIFTRTQMLSGGYSATIRQYDEMGRVEKESAPCDFSSCSIYWTENTYDDVLGRLLTQTRPFSDGSSTPVTTTFAYAGRTQTITGPPTETLGSTTNKVTTKVMDVNGWMRQSRDHDSYGQNFSYDAAGSLKSVTDTLSNNLFSATYSYGTRPFQTATTDMDLGSWTYTYNSLGELTSWTDASSNAFSQTYDALSRVLTRTESEGTTTWTYGTNSGSHNIGRLASVSMTNYSEALSYDSIGRLSNRSINAYNSGNDTGSAYAFDYAYSTTQGSLETLTYPTSTSSTRVKVKYGYAYGMLNTVTDWTSGSAGTVYWTANTQNVSGQTTQETLGNGVVTNRNFDAVTGRLNYIHSGVSGGTGLQNLTYAYDAIGNVTQRQATIGALGLTEDFYYDNLYRLEHSTLNNGSTTVTNLEITYDNGTPGGMGNITARSDVNGGATWTYDATKKHAVTGIAAGGGQGAISYEYDNNYSNRNGNMTKRGGHDIEWTSYNYAKRLRTATEDTTFYYGPDRQYYRQDYTGPSVTETTYYIGGVLEKVCIVTDCLSGTVDWRHSIVAEGRTVAIVSRKSTSVNAVSYPLGDSQGSGSTLTDGSGGIVARQSYTAFGLPRDGDDWDGAESSGDLTAMEAISRRGYTGHSMLGRMGLIHMNGRVQDAVTGRFLSPDPTIPHPGFTQSYNRYAYVNNNPMTYIDPSGFADKPTYECEGCLSEILVSGELTEDQYNSLMAGLQFCQRLTGSTNCDTWGLRNEAANRAFWRRFSAGANESDVIEFEKTVFPCLPGAQCHYEKMQKIEDWRKDHQPQEKKPYVDWALAATAPGAALTGKDADAYFDGQLKGLMLCFDWCPGGEIGLGKAAIFALFKDLRSAAAASEKTALDMAKRIEKDLGKDARNEFHDMKEGADRTFEELKSHARELYEEAGKALPKWFK